jgi:hypothetical protein
VLVLFEGRLTYLKNLTNFISASYFISDNHLNILRKICLENNLNTEQILKETDNSNTMEGLYIKVEETGEVKERYKYVRSSFLTNIINSESHWLDRPIVPNVLKSGIDIFKIE